MLLLWCLVYGRRDIIVELWHILLQSHLRPSKLLLRQPQVALLGTIGFHVLCHLIILLIYFQQGVDAADGADHFEEFVADLHLRWLARGDELLDRQSGFAIMRQMLVVRLGLVEHFGVGLL